MLALAIFSGARLKLVPSLMLVLGLQGATDLVLYVDRGWDAVSWVYVAIVANVVLGRISLADSKSTVRVLGVGVFGFAAFFVLTNFGSWVASALPQYSPHSASTLLLAFAEGLEFLRQRPGQAFGHLLCCGALFQTHAVLAKSYVPAEQVEYEEVR